jgi:deazaflavin-dependent oxidoreductase (nitroreductase family)
MSFDATNGTRGARQARGGGAMNLVNRLAMSRVRRTGGRVFGNNLLVLRTVGAKSGEERDVPVACFGWDEGSWLVVASAGGAARNPAWYYNLAAHPDRVSIDVDHTTIPVTASQLHGADRAHAWEAITTASPQFSQYETKTDREIPVIRLTRRD